jgi:hypothetical protein
MAVQFRKAMPTDPLRLVLDRSPEPPGLVLHAGECRLEGVTAPGAKVPIVTR